MIALFNFNDYLGGGETIFTRWAEYLQKNNIECKLFYPAKSFIADELNRLAIEKNSLCPYDGNVNYYYMTVKERKAFIDWILQQLQGLEDIK